MIAHNHPYNCGSSDCYKPERLPPMDQVTSTAKTCDHENVGFYKITFWIFKRQIAICFDCEEIFDKEEITEYKAEKAQ